MVLDLKSRIPVISDWPRPGVDFLDLCGILHDTEAFRSVIEWLTWTARLQSATSIVAVESRGFVLAAPVAAAVGVPLILARKAGKLPGDCVRCEYDTEYSRDCVEIQRSAPMGVQPLIIDDVLATGGTLKAVADLVANNWQVDRISASVLIVLEFLPGAQLIRENGINLLSHTGYK